VLGEVTQLTDTEASKIEVEPKILRGSPNARVLILNSPPLGFS